MLSTCVNTNLAFLFSFYIFFLFGVVMVQVYSSSSVIRPSVSYFLPNVYSSIIISDYIHQQKCEATVNINEKKLTSRHICFSRIT